MPGITLPTFTAKWRASTRTERAAVEFAALATSLRTRGHDPVRAAHFLMRLLFCLFAEDIGLLPARLWPGDLTDEAILELLLALNLAREPA